MITEQLQCSTCFKKVRRVYLEGSKPPVTDVFYCDDHGFLTMDGMELWEEQ